jgi:hypothetical protein
MAVLNNVTTANGYTAGNTLRCPLSEVQNLIITGQAIFIQYKEREGGYTGQAPAFIPELFLPPGYYNWARDIEEIQVRSAVTGKSAQVTINTVP